VGATPLGAVPASAARPAKSVQAYVPYADCKVAIPADRVLQNQGKPWLEWQRDGGDLSRIVAETLLIRNLPGPDTNLKDNPDALYELAERYVVKWAVGAGGDHPEVRRLAAADLSGRPAFELELTYQSNGVDFRRLIYGWANGRFLHTLAFDAADLFYFQRDLPEFRAVIGSLCEARKR
jgi:hypothetical protein